MKILILLFCQFIFTIIVADAQVGYRTERVNRVKNITVKIIIDGKTVGTGFFISSKGHIASCFHVFTSVRIVNGTLASILEAETREGIKFKLGFDMNLVDYSEVAMKADLFDFIVLKIIENPPLNIRTIPIGSFDNLSEGENV